MIHYIIQMGFFSSLWNGLKTVAGKIRDGANWAIDGAKNVAGKVGNGIKWIKDTAGKISNIPVVGNILKSAWNALPYTGKIEKAIDQVDNLAKTVKDTADLGSGIINAPSIDEANKRYNASKGKLRKNANTILAPFKPIVT